MRDQLSRVMREDLVTDMDAWADALRQAKRLGDRGLQLRLLRIRADADGRRWSVPKNLEPLIWHGVELCWDARSARLFAADCAERVLSLFEEERPDDMRPRVAIDVARQYVMGDATEEKRSSASSAAWASFARAARAEEVAAAGWAANAACQAAAQKTWSPHRAAQSARAARAEEVAAAGWATADAARAEERAWQNDRLAQYLLGH